MYCITSAEIKKNSKRRAIGELKSSESMSCVTNEGIGEAVKNVPTIRQIALKSNAIRELIDKLVMVSVRRNGRK
jgi:hypothetical protein